jgi:hypothetical protein
MNTSLFDVFQAWSRWILNATLLFVLPLGLNAQSRPTTQSGINASSSQVQIMTTASTDSSASVRVSIPGTPDKFSAHLNGKDVSSRFSSVNCDGATCKAATFTQADGFRTEKDVLTVDAGHGVTGRLRFGGLTTATTTSSSTLPQLKAMTATPKAQSIGSPSTSFLPPTVALTTLNPGGWDPPKPWISVNGVNYPDVAPGGATCQGSFYLAIVLDRQTLVEKTAAPESSPICLQNSAAVKQYLSALTANDLVILGSNWETAPDAGLDLTAIGGSNWPGKPGDGSYPAGMFAIGTPGATAGSAYQAYYVSRSGYEQVNVFAKGVLQEDAYGNYNFQSSDVAEFTVSPMDTGTITSPSDTNTSAVAISVPNAQPGQIQQYVYTAQPGVDSGYWLFTLSRVSLNPYPNSGCSAPKLSSDGSTAYISGCGTFYRTYNPGDPQDETIAYQSLAAALQQVNPWQVAVLVTIGQASDGGASNSPWYVGGFNGGSNYNIPSNGFLEFYNALSAMGGTPNIAINLLSPSSAYTFIGSNSLGSPLNGNSIESSTVFSAQGQSGFVHGILQRNVNGLYMPQQTNQEPVQLFALKGGFKDPEFRLTEVALQQPVDWPSNSSATLLPPSCGNCIDGANTIAGQIAAYKYISYTMLWNYYMKGIAPNGHLDDIHYFFTGSFNTSINYHTYDPANLVSPSDPSYSGNYHCDSIANVTDIFGNPATQCTINSFSADGEQLIFTSTDFYAVKNQLSTEVVDLTNTMQFLVTGSTSLKSVVASGTSNMGLALTGAAASVLGSALQPAPPQTIVTTSWQNIVGMIGGVSSLLSAVPGLGELAGVEELATTAAKAFGGFTTVVGGAGSLAAGAGQITSSITSTTLPSAFSTFSDTISDLANGALEGPLSIGFDTLSDNVTSDWGRLSVIGPMTADPNNLVFFAPNQVSQSVAITGLTQAASRSFYISLMPAINFGIDYYPGLLGFVNPTADTPNIPDMGHSYNADDYSRCSAYYLNPQENSASGKTDLGTPVPNTYVYYPTIAGVHPGFPNNMAFQETAAIDMYVIGGLVSYYGTDTPAIKVPSAGLASYLFTSAGLNLPIQEFTAVNGPLSMNFTNMAGKNRTGSSASSVCAAYLYPMPEPGAVLGAAPPNGETATATTLSAQAISILGDDLPVSATVMAGSTPVAVGSVYFTVDGSGMVNANLNAQGTASTVIPSAQLTRGTHQIVALYSLVAPYGPSQSPALTLNVSTTAPDINLSASASSMNVSYGSISSPITLQLTSLGGLAGAVNLSCSGLPVGMTCSFNPAQVTLTASGPASASMTINGGTASGSSFWIPGVGILLLPVSLVCLGRIRKGARQLGGILCLLALSLVGISCLSGCNGGSSPSSNTFQETGTKTVIISASSGTVSRTIPIQVTIQ